MVATLLPTRKGDDLARGQLAPALGRAQARSAFEDNHELLLGEMVVVGVGGLAGRQLPQAQPETLATGLAAEPCATAAEAGVLARLIEEGSLTLVIQRSVSAPRASGCVSRVWRLTEDRRPRYPGQAMRFAVKFLGCKVSHADAMLARRHCWKRGTRRCPRRRRSCT